MCLHDFSGLKNDIDETIFSGAISKRHFELNDDVYADYVENLLNDINEESNPTSNFAFGDDSKYEW